MPAARERGRARTDGHACGGASWGGHSERWAKGRKEREREQEEHGRVRMSVSFFGARAWSDACRANGHEDVPCVSARERRDAARLARPTTGAAQAEKPAEECQRARLTAGGGGELEAWAHRRNAKCGPWPVRKAGRGAPCGPEVTQATEMRNGGGQAVVDGESGDKRKLSCSTLLVARALLPTAPGRRRWRPAQRAWAQRARLLAVAAEAREGAA